MTVKTRRLRELLDSGKFLYMPSAATPLEGRLAEAMGVPVVYTGGYVTGASRMITEPLLTMDEQVRVAGEVARAVQVPLIADAGVIAGRDQFGKRLLHSVQCRAEQDLRVDAAAITHLFEVAKRQDRAPVAVAAALHPNQRY